MCKLHFHNEDVSDESHVKVGKGKGGTDPIPFRRSVINLNNTSRTFFSFLFLLYFLLHLFISFVILSLSLSLPKILLSQLPYNKLPRLKELFRHKPFPKFKRTLHSFVPSVSIRCLQKLSRGSRFNTFNAALKMKTLIFDKSTGKWNEIQNRFERKKLFFSFFLAKIHDRTHPEYF